MRAPFRLDPRGNRAAPLVFKQGAHPPYAVRWYGITSLFGHFRNFIASAIASESVDSRDWMRPLGPNDLLANALRVLGVDPAGKTSLQEGLNRPLWIDFVADTGDDRDVSHAVGRMIFAEYAIREGDADVVLPRGDVLLIGGDTAYPVATADEIQRRVVAPWNEVLREEGRNDGRARVLLGIPGNHDWYDGLDGFGRLFRRRPHADDRPHDAAKVDSRRSHRARTVGLVARQLHLDEVGGFLKLLSDAWKSVSAFFRGSKVARRRNLALDGYEPIQESSFWALPLAKDLDVWGVDRQLGRLDFRQRTFFLDRKHDTGDTRVLFIAPDPAIALGNPHEPGTRMMSACKLSFARDRVFYLSGDMHHYERRPLGASLHVISGGGGAFLHGTRIEGGEAHPAACAYPDAAESRRLVAQVPFRLMFGGAGYLVHVAFAILASVEFSAGLWQLFRLTSLLVAVGIGFALYGIAGHNRDHRVKVLAVTVPFAGVLGFMPWGLVHWIPHVVPLLERDTVAMLAYAFLSAFVFGLYLMVVAIMGLELQQAFTVLGHPGFKHFTRLRLSPDGTIDAWVIGKDDPLADHGPWLIDRFTWTGARPTQDAARATRASKPGA